MMGDLRKYFKAKAVKAKDFLLRENHICHDMRLKEEQLLGMFMEQQGGRLMTLVQTKEEEC